MNSGGGSMQKVGGPKYSVPNINVYVLMIFTAFSLKSGGALAPIPPPMMNAIHKAELVMNRLESK